MPGQYMNSGNRKRFYGYNIVEFVISKYFEDCASEFARRLTEVAKKNISRQTVQGWRNRGKFSRDIIPAVHQLTGLPVYDLITSKTEIGAAHTATLPSVAASEAASNDDES
jgi:hypothetical protein